MELGRAWGQSLVSVAIYVEGGGNSRHLKADCRRAFSTFLENAGLKGRMPRIVACGSRNNAFDQFQTRLTKAADKKSILLLVDSEGPISPATKPWSHLEKRDPWKCPPGAGDDNVHLMVQCMESWFLADKECLEEHFGPKFRRASLPANPKIEDVPKSDVMSGLKSATKACKSGYSKGSHSFRILAKVDPQKVKAASLYADRLIETVSARSKAR